MSSTVASRQPLDRALSLAEPVRWQALTAALLAAGLALGLMSPDADISWLLMAAERMFHGQRLYVDVLEVNPPLSVLLYAPAQALADVLGLRPEAVTAGLCTLGILASLGLAGAILEPLIAGDEARRWKLAAAGAFVLCALPAAAFGERDHIAVMALTPFLAIVMVRSEGRSPSLTLAVLAGLGFGLGMAVKPYFAAAGALPVLWAMWRARAFRPWAQPELWAAALAAGGYGAAVLIWFPVYLTQVLPVLRDAYLPIRTPMAQLLMLPAIPLALGSVAVAVTMKLDRRWTAVPMLAAVGGAAAYLVQGKGWTYHAYPMLAFAALGLLVPAVMAGASQTRTWSRLDRCMLLVPSLGAIWVLSQNVHPRPLARAVAAAAPPAPSLIAVTGNIGMGIPLVPILGARWVGAAHSDWIAEGALRREDAGSLDPATRARLDRLIAKDRTRLARDIHAGRPDVVLFDRKTFDWRSWALQDPSIARDLRAYRLAGVVKRIEIWARR